MGKKVSVGGQAVIEGVMMRGSKGVATAIRKSNGDIEVEFDEIEPLTKKNKVFSLPIIRGFVTLIDSLIIGIKTLNYSASFIEEDEYEEKEPSKFDKWMEEKFKGKAADIVMAISFIISMALSIFIFFIIPTFAANGFKRLNVNNTIALNILEGIIRVGIFLSYIYLISKMNDIKRVFEYHGAEHKTIFCYESGEELIPENAKKQGRLHPRCGTNFLFLVMIVSIILFSFTGWNSIWQRIFYRIILLPVVSGVTYEIIKWMGSNNNKCTKILSYPGLMLQKLTTREPDLEQLEVAIVSLKVAEGIETAESIKEKYNKKLEDEDMNIEDTKDLESVRRDIQ
ncbi:DUF1385 domain-containing protein [Clostridium novyi]|uniref:DUF1385 domain-containing protein n=1 Tax=Clostridium novyi (strain NT) TaxID=386415 RepID=A0Q314_CLONN|nr:DUF1385 domain-containing protein [Clostridium novyi]ABK60938.1 conserved hypothetical protein [Clostridium novyi NT]KEH87027.1 membrane protein [Clostridium novyi A str. NCTC 538]